MIRKLAISNFYSIKGPQEIDFVIAGNAPDIPGRFAKPISGSEDRIPKVVALFGPNASGKTTVLRAITFMQWFARSSFDLRPGQVIPYFSFSNKESIDNPTELSIEFDAQILEEKPHCVYRYDLSLQQSNEGRPSKVILERLSYAPLGRFRRIFERFELDIKFGDEFEAKKNDPRTETVRSDASVISTFAKFAHPLSTQIIAQLNTLQTNIFLQKFEPSEEDSTTYYLNNPDVLIKLNNYIRILDLGIKNVQVKLSENKPVALFEHAGIDFPLILFSESKGTQNFYKLFPHLNYVLNVGGIAILDEFDNDIHPLLLPEIVHWFYDSKINKHNAQLIMSCHNATLLEDLVKEEVYFTEKNNRGETEIYGLKDIDKVRRDTNIYKKYLGGAFGAVPHIG